MKEFVPSGRGFLFSYFTILIIVGTVLLSLPISWQGAQPLVVIDALFTATSAVTVTGLSTVDTGQFTVFGYVCLMLLMQAGGLGVVIMVVLALLARDAPVSVHGKKLMGDYFLPSVESRPRVIITKIFVYALVIEFLGFLCLWAGFSAAGVKNSVFVAAFHAVSAFCNAGFSTFSNNLENFAGFIPVTGFMAMLIILGGIGFVVIDDIRKRVAALTRRLRSHTVLVLVSTAVFLLAGTIFFAVAEWNHAFAFLGDQPGLKLWESFFMSVVPRTAGFDSIAPVTTSEPSQLFTMFLMLVGGAPSSTAGGLKVTTTAILFLLIVRGLDNSQDLSFGRRRLDRDVVGRAAILFVRAGFILFLLILALCIVEAGFGGKAFGVLAMAFETVSAFCTVGLSLGITGQLDNAGKIIIIITMFLGRAGLVALAFPQQRAHQKMTARLPKGEVIIG